MMVDDDDIGGLRGAARLQHVAARELRALLAEAVLARRGDHGPDGRLLGQIGELGRDRRTWSSRPSATPARAAAPEPRSPGSRERLLRGELQPVAAEIIGAAFEQRHLDRHAERPREQRHVAAKQLVLQRARSRGDDDAASRQAAPAPDRRRSCRYPFPPRRSAASPSGKRAPHRRGHGRLLRAIGVARDGPRQRPLGTEHFFESLSMGILARVRPTGTLDYLTTARKRANATALACQDVLQAASGYGCSRRRRRGAAGRLGPDDLESSPADRSVRPPSTE